jgi:GNAT superfamily N-acetyltransferase
MTYWGKCFPNRFDVVIDIERAQFYGAYDLPGSDDPRVIDGSRAKVCFVTVERVGIRGTPTASVEAKLRKIIAADRETWNAGEYNFVAFVWEATTCMGEPAGFKVFDIRPKRNSRGEISEVTFDARLLYIRVAQRGRGVGQLLSAAIAMWLDQCRLYWPHAAKRGIRVVYESEYYSEGGEKCGNILRSHFLYMEETNRDAELNRFGWHIREFEDESGI